MENSHKVRLSDIADRLNVSTVTVSKAMADKEGVSDELREKIKRTAREMGYRQKNLKQQSFRQENSTGNIGIVIPSRFFERTSSFYWNMYNALARELQNNGYYAILEQLDAQSEFDLTIPGVIRDSKVDGVIVMGQVSIDYAHYFTRNYPNFFFLDFYINDENTDSVTTDNFYSEYMMTEYLISQGHKDIRYVGNFKSTSSITDRYMGFLKAMLENGLKTELTDIIDDRDKDGIACPIILPEKMPTAFVCNCDQTAIKLIELLNGKGYRVPEDISVVGFDNYVAEGSTVPALTTVGVDQVATARTVVDLLLKKVNGQPYTKGHTVIGGKLIIRNSVQKIQQITVQ
ncbi:MAG: LacI family DNA-binding transcriptional regulator [Treponema sp.]|nr:LacI family DNA-binding transcriptional regulator [Treponema sp.]